MTTCKFCAWQWNMTPSFAADEFANGGATNSVLPGKFMLCNRACRKGVSNIADLFACEFGAAHAFAACFSTLAHHVLGIVLRCAKKEMCWVATASIGCIANWISYVAVVKHLFTFWNGTIYQFPCDAMSIDPLVIVGVDLPVTFIVATGEPKPAFIGAVPVNVTPKAFGKGTPRRSIVTANKTHWFTPDISSFVICHFRDWRGLTAATIAQLHKLEFGLGWLWGTLGVHRNLSFPCLIRGRVDARCPVFLLPLYRSILAQMREICQPQEVEYRYV